MNKTILITGCTTGIGYEAAKVLAKKGHNLILLARNPEKINALVKELETINPDIQTYSYICDFENLSDVVKTAKQIKQNHPHIDVLINNAGIIEMKKRMTPDGFEITWVVNYFAPFILTHYLAPVLVNSAKSTKDIRLINVASAAHRFGNIDFNGFSNFHIQLTYQATKLANVLHSGKLSRELESTGVTVNSLHPGLVASGIWRTFPSFIAWLIRLVSVDTVKGAETIVYLATTENFKETGKYFVKSRVSPPSKLAQNVELQNKLYAHTLELLKKYLN